MYPHDVASTIISICIDLSQKGESKNWIHVLCILFHNLNTLRFYENKYHFTFPEFDKGHFEYQHDGASTIISRICVNMLNIC